MAKLYWGIGLGIVGFLWIILSIEQKVTAVFFLGIFAVLGGSILLYYGIRYKRGLRVVSEIALKMLTQEGKIQAVDIARKVGLSEFDVRLYINDSQRKGVIPFKADIV